MGRKTKKYGTNYSFIRIISVVRSPGLCCTKQKTPQHCYHAIQISNYTERLKKKKKEGTNTGVECFFVPHMIFMYRDIGETSNVSTKNEMKYTFKLLSRQQKKK